jgi:hypothetical protein
MPDDALCEVRGCRNPARNEFTTTDGGASENWQVCEVHKRTLDDGAEYTVEGKPGQGGSIVLTER